MKRRFDDLSDQDKGVYIVREEIKKYHNKLVKSMERDRDDGKINTEYANISIYITHQLLGDSINICNECLDIATLGDIE
jgi:hypothetical protein